MNFELPKNKSLILFDGVCNLCNSSVQYVIQHDKHNKFLFAPLQSEVGKQIIETYKIDTQKTDSILLYTTEKGVDYKSTAALRIAHNLGFPQYLVGVFFIIPSFIRNWVYDYIARNRYKWYGKKDTCMIPSPGLNNKFLN